VRNIPHVKIAEMNELKVWYDFGEKIGEGGFGMVMSVKDRSTNKKWAMKVVFKTNASSTLESNSSQLFLFKGRESADVGATGDTDSEADPTPPTLSTSTEYTSRRRGFT
jgi:serine/threonine protein kinase